MRTTSRFQKLATAMVNADQSIANTLAHMQNEVALIVAPNGRLCGLVTDGDIRRAFLRGARLDTPIAEIMTTEPYTARPGMTARRMRSFMLRKGIRHLPVIDDNERPIGLELLKDHYRDIDQTSAVIMAGGMGTRLRPLTEHVPKPLLHVGKETILDGILHGLRDNGIENVIISVNYLSEQIRQHVGGGDSYQLNIDYVEEQRRMGTAGSLTLLNPRPSGSFLVMNADLVTDLDFRALMRFHHEQENDLTMCVRRQSTTIPYGVVSLDEDNSQVTEIEEKPEREYFANAGIYMLEPELIDLVPGDSYFDMVSLIQTAMGGELQVGAYPILEYWRDIGRPVEMQQAKRDLAHRSKPTQRRVAMAAPQS